MRIGMVAGEASGDLLASAVLAETRRRSIGHAGGIGGPAMVAADFDAWWPSDLLAVHGYAAALKVLPKLLLIRRRLGDRMLSWPADCFVGVDAPDFNLGLETRLRAAGVRTLHFVSPSIWAWRRERIDGIRKAVDRMLLVFPFETAIYREAGIPASYVGHPLADAIPMEPDRAGARQALDLPPDATVIAVMPGSRAAEIEHIGPAFLGAVERLARRYPDGVFVLPSAGPERHRQLQTLLAAHPAAAAVIRLVQGRSHQVLEACDFTLIASGTATLEAALYKRPMVIAYKMSPWSYRLMKSRGYLPYVGLPNILAGSFIVPELIQDAATPQALADAVAAGLDDSVGNARLIERFTAMHQELACGCAVRVADAIAEVMA